MVYQHLLLGLTYQQIAKNLSVDTSTVWRAVEKFQAEGTVGSKYCKGPQTLTKFQKFVIMQTVLEKPAAYLREICTDLLVKIGTTVSQPSVGSFSASTFQGKSYIWLPNNAMNNYDCHLFLIVRFIHQK